MSRFDRLYGNVLLPPVRFVTRNDAEVAHNWFVTVMTQLSKYPRLTKRLGAPIVHPLLQQSLMGGLTFPNPFGTAAGMDKNATMYPALTALTGAGHVELGGVTLLSQSGNERPRLVRVGANHLINAMGFPNVGIDRFSSNFCSGPQSLVPLGVQITKNKATADADAADEYAALVRAFRSVSSATRVPDYFTINVSSPNTPGLRSLQAPEMLEKILRAVTDELDAQSRSRRRLLVKLAPDIEVGLIDATISLIEKYDTAGLVLTNSTTQRPVHSRYDDRPGGFSGSALYARSSELVEYAAARLAADRVLIACGGIDSPERAYEMLRYADMVDAYTSLVLGSPRQFRTFARYVQDRMTAEGITSLAQLRAPNRPESTGSVL